MVCIRLGRRARRAVKVARAQRAGDDFCTSLGGLMCMKRAVDLAGLHFPFAWGARHSVRLYSMVRTGEW